MSTTMSAPRIVASRWAIVTVPVEKKNRVVMSVLAREVSVFEPAGPYAGPTSSTREIRRANCDSQE